MPDLTERAEEALLGAMISDASQAAEVTYIDATALTDPTRRAVWTAISSLSEIAAGTSGPEFADLILATTDDLAITSDYLTRLALSTPTPDAVHAYARLVAEAALNRALTSPAGATDPADFTAGHPADRSGARYAASQDAARSALGEDKPAAPAPTSERAIREEQFLAGIIGHPELADWIRLDPGALTSPGLRDIYKATIAAGRLGEPLDEVILPWRTASIIAYTDYSAGRVTTAETVAAAVPPGTITRLLDARIEPLTALEAGRDLLADQARTQIAASAAARRPAASHDRAQAAGREALASQQVPLLQPPASELGRRPQLSQDGN
jgi:DnaB-like helicase N terminal domain